MWEQNPEIFYLDDGTPLFTTTDAPYFLGLAKAIKDEGSIQAFNETRSYPLHLNNNFGEQSNSNCVMRLCLSVFVSLIQTTHPKGNIESGPLSYSYNSFSNGIMIVFAFGAAGYWLPGTIAAAGGTLSFSHTSPVWSRAN